MSIRVRNLMIAFALCLALPVWSAQEEKPKNVKVLKDLSHDQLIAAMTFIRTSLSVRCDYCHVMSDTERDMASDQKKPKVVARKMISMVLDINRNNFENKPEVSCYTCHQGNAKPVTIPPLPVPQTHAESASFVPARDLASPPSPSDIIRKYTEALGTKEALAGIQNAKTTIWKATHISMDGKSTNVEVYEEKPDRIAIIQGPVTQVFDGKIGWIKDNEGVEEMDSVDIERLNAALTPYQVSQLEPVTSALTLQGKDTIAGQEAFVLQEKDNERIVKLYFDTHNGLLLRKLTLRTTPVGTIPQQYDFEDYGDWNGVKLPYTIHVVGIDPRFTATIKLSDIMMNTPIESSRFAKP